MSLFIPKQHLCCKSLPNVEQRRCGRQKRSKATNCASSWVYYSLKCELCFTYERQTIVHDYVSIVSGSVKCSCFTIIYYTVIIFFWGGVSKVHFLSRVFKLDCNGCTTLKFSLEKTTSRFTQVTVHTTWLGIHRFHSWHPESQSCNGSCRFRPPNPPCKCHHSNMALMYSHPLKYQSINR